MLLGKSNQTDIFMTSRISPLLMSEGGDTVSWGWPQFRTERRAGTPGGYHRTSDPGHMKLLI